MAAATCTLAGLVTAGQCFTKQQFGAQRQKVILAYLWWKYANSATNEEVAIGLLVNNSQCFADGLTSDQKDAAIIGILNRGYAGLEAITFNITIDELTAATAAEAIKCLQNLSDNQLDGTIIYSMCRFFGAAV